MEEEYTVVHKWILFRILGSVEYESYEKKKKKIYTFM